MAYLFELCDSDRVPVAGVEPVLRDALEGDLDFGPCVRRAVVAWLRVTQLGGDDQVSYLHIGQGMGLEREDVGRVCVSRCE